jgi:DNA-binding transcriptional ArsR family regulator
MPAPIPPTLRRLILSRSRRGQTATDIARALRLSPRTVRHLLRRARDPANPPGPAYRPGPGRPAHDPLLRDRALALRQQHPSWGAGYIRLHLAAEADPAAVPSERTLQRWFRRERHPPAAAGRRPSSAADRAIAPHDIWQMDAVEQLRTADGQGACWLRLVDEYTGAFLATTVFPPILLGPCPRG